MTQNSHTNGTDDPIFTYNDAPIYVNHRLAFEDGPWTRMWAGEGAVRRGDAARRIADEWVAVWDKLWKRVLRGVARVGIVSLWAAWRRKVGIEMVGRGIIGLGG